MNKSEIMAKINTDYIGVSEAINPGSEGAVNGVIKYMVNILDTGIDQATGADVARRNNITFYVYHEGENDEKAYFDSVDPITRKVDTDISANADNFISYHNIYSSVELRKRLIGFIAKQSYSIINEDPATENHATRIKWAFDAIKDPEKYLNAFMVGLSNNSDIRKNGNSVLDNGTNWWCENDPDRNDAAQTQVVNNFILILTAAYNL